MNLAHIDLANLVISPANMRAKHKGRDVADLIPSVRARGVLVPLLVRPNGTPDTYEIIAGRRRYFAAKALAPSSGEPIMLPCAIIEQGDDAAAVEASLLENVARLDADEVSQWETFARLIKEGRSAEDIAATFGIPDSVVRRVLALGNLVPRILALYRTGQLDAGTVRALTMATVQQQRAWLELFDSEQDHAPTGRNLKSWLFGGTSIPTSTALFDLAEYTAPIVADLFEDASYFSDSAQFWELQNLAIERKAETYLNDGWRDVEVLNNGRWFERWAFEKRSKTKGGRVYIAVSDGGAVEIHEGYLPRKEAERHARAESAKPASVRPELTVPLRRYVDLHRHTAVRTTLLDEPWLALRLMLAHAIAGSSLWTVQLERQRAEKAETRQSVIGSKADAAFAERRREAFKQLGLSPDTGAIVRGAGEGGVVPALGRLMQIDDVALLGLVPLVMGETLDAEGAAIEPVGTMLGLDMATVWHADEAFFSLLRDRGVLVAILTEVAGPVVASANADVPAKVLKSILRDHLLGQNGREKVEGWVPRWLRFPSSRYLDEAAGSEPSSLDDAEKPADVNESAEFETTDG